MKTPAGHVEILAFCEDSIPGLVAQIRSARRDLSAISDLSETGAKTRSQFDAKADYRMLVAAAAPEAVPELLDYALKQLESLQPESFQPLPGLFFGKYKPEGKLAFVFPGQGSQYPLMGMGLAETFPESDPVIKAAEQTFDRNPPLLSRIYPEYNTSGKAKNTEIKALQETDVAQPAIGTVSLIMLKILQRHGIFADAACGHSFGELTALCAGERIRETDFMKLAVARGKFMAEAGGTSTDRGGMLAVRASMETIEALIEKHSADVVLANKNSPKQAVISGPTEEIERMREICKKNRILSARLPVSAAFHSRLILDAAAPFKELVSATRFFPGSIPVYSNTTAAPYPKDKEAAQALLGDHLIQPVNFIDGIVGMYEAGVRTFIEVGPKAVLTGLVKKILSDLPHDAYSLDGTNGKQPALLDLAFALCRTAALGYRVNLEKWPADADPTVHC